MADSPARRTETEVQVSDIDRAQTGRPLSPGSAGVQLYPTAKP